MKLSDLEYAPAFDLLAPTALFRIQRSRVRAGTVRIGRLLLPPSTLLNGRFDVAGVPVGYFAEAPDTAAYEALARRETTFLSIQTITGRSLLCVQASRTLTLLDLRMHASSWPVLQSLRLAHTQELAADAHAQGFAGIVYCSAQQNNMACYAVFGDAMASLKVAWTERLVEPGTGNLHTVIAAALKGSQVPLTP
ncbi:MULTISPECIES: RES family NAD+ phosphorylase [unclassified Roseateles]|uniref:RES family NAD+ phosphorylase n=1 Tax=unclassified Roseateles TaxID=2626991 RepID=UPI0022B8CB15|nr:MULTISPECIES: RES family NAD+ phosphorylase [unclassified Roseateles]MCZ7882091.1 RES family NAD+ phosphorylase [Paucibacter sp. M5-1]MDC6169584.1 RES family NAD+ phosphorylase [Paucibacter sp. XJ19-41]